MANENGVFVDVAEMRISMGMGIAGTLFKSNQDGHYFSEILGSTSRTVEGKGMKTYYVLMIKLILKKFMVFPA